jgi:hypothetical protein
VAAGRHRPHGDGPERRSSGLERRRRPDRRRRRDTRAGASRRESHRRRPDRGRAGRGSPRWAHRPALSRRAVFGDPRLPAEYAAGAWSDDEAALGAAVERIADLPAEVAAELRPYVVRPTDPTSVFFGASGAATAEPRTGPQLAAAGGLALVVPTVTCPSTGWGYVDGSAAFRVWGRCNGSPSERLEREAQIQLVAGWMEQIWADEVAYLGRPPIPDEGTVDQGANPDLGAADRGGQRIDIYLTAQCVTRDGDCAGFNNYATAWPSPQRRGSAGSRRSSGFIVVNRAMTANPAFARAALAHEFFHVMQNAFNREGVRVGDRSFWFVEASATWAQWRFAPEGSAVDHHTMTPGRFESFQGSPFSLQEAAHSNRYWSWAWPLFMQQASAGSVAAAWQAIEGRRTEAEVNRAIDRQVPFASRFRDFAVRAHNEVLTPTTDADLRTLFPEPAVGAPRVPPGEARMDEVVELHADVPGIVAHQRSEFLPSLYAVYRPFEVDDDVGRVTFDFSGLAAPGSFDVDAIVKIKDKGWERRKLENGETTFCRDKAKDRVEEIVIVLSNHAIDPNERVVGTWTVESLQVGCAAVTGTLTIERTASFLQLDPRLPYERHSEDLSATIVVSMRPDPDTAGYTDSHDPADPASIGSSYSITRETSAEKRLGDCTSSYSTESSGTWQFADRPAGADWENGITGFIDRASGTAGISIVVHYPAEVVENVCNYVVPDDTSVHDAFVCLDARLVEVDGGPDRIEVHCSSDEPAMGYSKTTLTIEGTLTLNDE